MTMVNSGLKGLEPRSSSAVIWHIYIYVFRYNLIMIVFRCSIYFQRRQSHHVLTMQGPFSRNVTIIYRRLWIGRDGHLD